MVLLIGSPGPERWNSGMVLLAIIQTYAPTARPVDIYQQLPSLSRRMTSPGVREPQFQPQTRHRPGVWCGRWIRSFPRPRTPVGRGRRSLALSGSCARQINVHAEQASSSDLTMMRQYKFINLSAESINYSTILFFL